MVDKDNTLTEVYRLDVDSTPQVNDRSIFTETMAMKYDC